MSLRPSQPSTALKSFEVLASNRMSSWLVRTTRVDQDLIDKIALFCDVDREGVVPLETADTIYAVPIVLNRAGLDDFVVRRLELPSGIADLAEWRDLVIKARGGSRTLRIGVVGKYIDLEDAYISVREALNHSAWFHDCRLDIRWIHSELLEKDLKQVRWMDSTESWFLAGLAIGVLKGRSRQPVMHVSAEFRISVCVLGCK